MPYSDEEKKRECDRIEEQFSKCRIGLKTEEIEVEELMLAMRDGVRLKTYIYRPKNYDRLPAIVFRSCYPDADVAYRLTAREYAKRGFAYIYQYCRGTGGSEGMWEPNVNERNDGKDTLDWVASLDWVENIGYTGSSYLALTGWVVADILPDKVKTMYLTHYGLFRHVSAYQDGLFRHDILTSWTMWNAGFPIEADYLESCRFRPHMEVDEKLWGQKIDWYRKWIGSPDSDDPYWNTGFWGMLKEIPAKVNVPIYMGEGWYDHHLGSAIATYKALSEEAKAHSTFLIGAWDHNFNFVLEGREADQAGTDEVLRCFDWFYEILVEKKLPDGRILNYICNEDRWYERSTYEIEDQEKIRFYLADRKALNSNVYALSASPQEEPGAAQFVYDPDDPVPSHGAESLMASSADQGSLRQQPLGWREDVLSFLSDELERDITVAGQIKVCLSVSSDAEDTAFAVKVMEVMPSGESYNLRSGITTLGYRGHAARRLHYEPGAPVDITVDLWDIAWKIHKGSRVRVDITSSDFPQYAVHSNKAGVWSEQRETKKALQQVYFGGTEHVSYIEFPVLK